MAAEFRGISFADATASFHSGVKPFEKIVDPRSSWLGDEGSFGPLAFSLQKISDREIITGGETTAKLLLTCSLSDINLLRDKVHRWPNVKVDIQVVKVCIQV